MGGGPDDLGVGGLLQSVGAPADHAGGGEGGAEPTTGNTAPFEHHGGVEVDEPIEVAMAADEVFLVSTTRDVQAVARWDDRELTAPGPVTSAVAARWREREPELLGLDR